MIKPLKNYLSESTISGTVVIKTVEKPTDEQLKLLKRILERFELTHFEDPSEIKNDRSDFIDIKNRTVWRTTATVELPFSPYILHHEISAALRINPSLLIVRSQAEPIEQYAEIEQEKKSNDIVTAARLSTKREYEDWESPNIEDLFGDEYNKSLLNYLAKVKEDRKSTEVEPDAPLFSWLDMSKVKPNPLDSKLDTADYNADMDTPKPVYKYDKSVKPPASSAFQDRFGGFDASASPNQTKPKGKKNS